jgi:two-component system, OmpR family, sensor histidine kinase KdpD
MRLRDTERRITSKVPQGLPLIEVNAVLIAQLLGNLLDNALKYSSGPVELTVRATEAHLLVSVKDRGDTIAPDQVARIFQPYARNDHSGQRGAGLGLALCLAIAEAHGATLALKARPGGGNRFTLALPLSGQQPAGAQAMEAV